MGRELSGGADTTDGQRSQGRDGGKASVTRAQGKENCGLREDWTAGQGFGDPAGALGLGPLCIGKPQKQLTDSCLVTQ